MATGTVVSTMQAGSGGVSQKRGRAEQGVMVAREARAAVMKAATATHYMVVEEAGAVAAMANAQKAVHQGHLRVQAAGLRGLRGLQAHLAA